MKAIKAGNSKLIDVVLDGEVVKPCPFCGGQEIELAHTWTASYWMECAGCSAQIHGPRVGTNDYGERSHIMAANSALKAWNTRAALSRVLGDAGEGK